MKRYLFLKLGLSILIYAVICSRAQVPDKKSRDEPKPASENEQRDGTKNSLKNYQGVMGKPGVDFPVLTYIPRTAFTCRGMKSGYYADLETNCQVFHICDEGRKVSFLCPNGTIFQQSDLICDWWFKVDCASSPSLYEESAEQLYEDNIKRKVNRRVNHERNRNKVTSENTDNNTVPNKRNNSIKNDVRNPSAKSRNTQPRNRPQTQEIASNAQMDNSKETQVPSETASFVNTKYNNQQKSHYQTFNNFETSRVTYTSPKSSSISDTTVTKSVTEKVSRGGRTYDLSSSKVYYKNHKYNDNIITTTQHTIYSPTVPTITVSKYTTRKSVTQPLRKTTQYSSQSTTSKPKGFYITKELPETTYFTSTSKPFYSNHKSSHNYFNNPTSIPYTSPTTFPTTRNPQVNDLTFNTDEPKLYTSTISSSTARSPTTNRVTESTNYGFDEFHSFASTSIPIEDLITGKHINTGNTLFSTQTEPVVTEQLTGTSDDKTTSKFNQFTYLPKETNTSVPEPTIPTPYTTYTTPAPITEHLNSMIKTLEDLQTDNVQINADSRPGLNIPPSAGPNTLHSLAVYFATALDNIVSGNETDDSTTETSIPTRDDTTEYVSLLSRSTVEKYNSLFNEKNSSIDDVKNETVIHISDPESPLDLRAIVEHDVKNNDLESQQSGGLVNSTPRIRQLAQVFTQALSAYLDDPGTFKKILEEIRPTEPSINEEIIETTTNKDLSYTNEEDEVLDFSDADKSSTYSTTAASKVFKSTTESYTNDVSTHLPFIKTTEQSYHKLTFPTLNPLALHLNIGLNLSSKNVLENPSTEDDTNADDYLPVTIDDEGAKKRFTSKPYGFGVKPENSTPISIVSDVTTQQDWPDAILNTNQTFDPIAPFGDLLPPYEPSRVQKALNLDNANEEYLQSAHSQSFISHRNKIINDDTILKTTENSIDTTTTEIPKYDHYTSTQVPDVLTSTFSTSTINSEEEHSTKFDILTTTELAFSSTPTTTNPFTESTTNSNEYSTYPDVTTESIQASTSKYVPQNHWSTSPLVTKLWQTTLYVDPLIINRNLGDTDEHQNNSTESAEHFETSTPMNHYTTEVIDESIIDLKFSTTEDSSEATYSTLSSLFTTEEATTISSELNLNNLLNSTELEIASSQAHQIFGNLNVYQQDTLMQRMQQAESNSTVRRLILLLISTCDSRLSNNKTVQETRNSIIQALLNSTEPAKDTSDMLTADANRKGRYLGTDAPEQISVTAMPETTSQPSELSSKSSAISSRVETSVKTLDVHDVDQDTRALELLRSLYSLAAKWGKK